MTASAMTPEKAARYAEELIFDARGLVVEGLAAYA
jgi:hypothetical protein